MSIHGCQCSIYNLGISKELKLKKGQGYNRSKGMEAWRGGTVPVGQGLRKSVLAAIAGWRSYALESPGQKQMVLSKGTINGSLYNISMRWPFAMFGLG